MTAGLLVDHRTTELLAAARSGHHGLKILVLVLIVIAVAVAVVVITRRSRRRRDSEQPS